MLEVLDPKPNEVIVDVGCGTGELTRELAKRAGKVIGIDSDPQMIQASQSQFPNMDWRVQDARDFHMEQPVDAVFSNAALHWVIEPELFVSRVAKALKPGGRFVAEFGGKGNVASIADFLDRHVAGGSDKNPWYFPSVGEYASLLERHGLEVTFCTLHDRPTPLSEGQDGLRNWILMFGGSYLEGMDEEEKETLFVTAEKELRYLHDGKQWILDYRRIRVVAKKT
mmetsp:Transcript_6853/g.15652  ORF Transcript_6853/g.15652 Transcript_6853/m.15652 type:complete len:225 (-) Transcript_6853:378-1052(-)